MKVPEDVICQVCKKYFCCSDCRYKHEIKNHAIVVRKPMVIAGADDSSKTTIYLFCPICAKQPLSLKEEMYSEMLEHIKENHLPLNCRKCSKVYTKIEDLKEFSKCIIPQVLCLQNKSNDYLELYDREAPKSNAKTIHTTIATQTSPMRIVHDYNDTHITPISMINLRWKAKSKVTHEEFISDSVSSIKNISSINNSSHARSTGILSNANKGKLVRSTSTPLQAEIILSKPKEQTFNASGGHVSSIYNSGCDSESSLPVANQVGTPSKQSLDVNRYRKVGSRPKISAVTPLRQVMSKSIQKAIAEHGFAGNGRGGQNRRKMFQSIDTSKDQTTANTVAKVPSSPLDLRLSPALRRTASEPLSEIKTIGESDAKREVPAPQIRHEILLSSKKTTTESIVITSLEQLARVESITSIGNISENCVSTTNQLSCSDNNHSSVNSSGASSSIGSVYKSCRSVEIITSTETSAIKVEKNTYSTSAVVNELPSLGHSTALNVESNHIVPITPTTRIKGAIIKKNHIMFETPRAERYSPCDIFFTPEEIPVRKAHLPREKSENYSELEECIKLAEPRKLSGHFSPSRRPALRECVTSSEFGRIEDITANQAEYDDDVFVPTEKLVQKENTKPQTSTFWSLMTSVMRLPSLKGGPGSQKTDTIIADASSNSIIRRCASIAGSMVRSKHLVDEEKLLTLKRKRTYTTDNQSTYLSHLECVDVSTVSETYSATSKRFRIQGRKPIERMRTNS